MRTLFLLVFLATAVIAKADNFGFFADSTGQTYFESYTDRSISSNMGAFSYASVSKDGGQFLAGPTLRVGNLKLGVGLGIQTGQNGLRNTEFGCYRLSEKTSATLIFRGGGNGPWHKAILSQQITPDLSIAGLHKESSGYGAQIRYKMVQIELCSAKKPTMEIGIFF